MPVAALFCAAAVVSAENWPGFRGPRGDGTSLETGLPLQWSATESIAWRAKLAGEGHSSPVVWDQRVFVTSFEEDPSTLRKLISVGRHGKLIVQCLDRDTGRELWRHGVVPDSIEGSANGNSPATPTPVTDGERLYVYFGSFGLFALNTATGKLIWEAKLGPYPHHMGTAASPVLAGSRAVVVNVETDGPDFLLALDRSTGRELWRTPRRQKQAGYATAAVWNDRAIVAGHQTVKAYLLEDGRLVWEKGGMSTYVVPTPVIAGPVAIVTSSGPGGGSLLALRSDGSTAWSAERAASYVASPVIAGQLVFTIKDTGVMSAVDLATGALVWQQRLPEPGRYFASPVSVGGRIYATNEHGVTVVVAASNKFEVLAVNRLEPARTWASPAVSAGHLFLRAAGQLIAVGSPRF